MFQDILLPTANTGISKRLIAQHIGTVHSEKVSFSRLGFQALEGCKAAITNVLGIRPSTSLIVRRALVLYARELARMVQQGDHDALIHEGEVIRHYAKKGHKPAGEEPDDE